MPLTTSGPLPPLEGALAHPANENKARVKNTRLYSILFLQFVKITL